MATGWLPFRPKRGDTRALGAVQSCPGCRRVGSLCRLPGAPSSARQVNPCDTPGLGGGRRGVLEGRIGLAGRQWIFPEAVPYNQAIPGYRRWAIERARTFACSDKGRIGFGIRLRKACDPCVAGAKRIVARDGDRPMRAAGILMTGVFALAVIATPTLAGEDCTCKEIKKAGFGFCQEHESGQLFDVKLTSFKLYDALAGQEVETDKIKCEGCRKAAETNGTCEHCHVSIADGWLYHSKAAYTLALGKEVKADTIKCESCKYAAEKNGFCDGCDAGMVSHRMFKSRDKYDQAKEALALITNAVKTLAKCENCAVAMVKDGSCPTCKVAYKDGKKV